MSIEGEATGAMELSTKNASIATARYTAKGALHFAVLLKAIVDGSIKGQSAKAIGNQVKNGVAFEIVQIAKKDVSLFKKKAKEKNIQIYSVHDKTRNSPIRDFIIKKADISIINDIFNEMNYGAILDNEQKKTIKSQDQFGNSLKQMPIGSNEEPAKESIFQRLADANIKTKQAFFTDNKKLSKSKNQITKNEGR